MVGTPHISVALVNCQALEDQRVLVTSQEGNPQL